MIVVTGATGNVGRPLVRALGEAGEQVIAVSRRARAEELPAEVKHVQADLLVPGEVRPAFDGAEALFLLTGADWMADGGSPAILREILDGARAGGVGRVVLLSSQGVGTGRHSPGLEEVVKESGLGWTVLRAGGFHTNTFAWAEQVRTQRVVAAPFGEVALPTVDPADLAAVASLVLQSDGHAGATYTLTGPAAVTPREQAEAIGIAVGEPVRFVEQSRAEARAQLTQFMPEVVADATLDILGTPTPEEQKVSPDVEQLLGRPGRSYTTWTTENAAAFK